MALHVLNVWASVSAVERFSNFYHGFEFVSVRGVFEAAEKPYVSPCSPITQQKKKVSQSFKTGTRKNFVVSTCFSFILERRVFF